jgi:hypothetical protein
VRSDDTNSLVRLLCAISNRDLIVCLAKENVIDVGALRGKCDGYRLRPT